MLGNQQSGFQPGPTQTGLYSHRRWLEAGNFGFRHCTSHVAKTRRSNCKADLSLCFRLCRLLVFPCGCSLIFGIDIFSSILKDFSEVKLHEKTNITSFELVRHKLCCTATEDGLKLEYFLERR